MKLMLAMSVTFLAIAAVAAFAQEATGLKEGDKAPPFMLKGSDGKEYSLEQFAGKQAVVLAWFPKADTPG